LPKSGGGAPCSVVDEVHHLPALVRRRDGLGRGRAGEDASAWSRALQPLLEAARLRLLLSGTLERGDGRAILWLPYRAGSDSGTRALDLEAPGWAVVGYSRAEAIAERAVLPVTFGALDGEASWLQGGRAASEETRLGPHRLSGPHPSETTRPALFTALRTGFAHELLREAFRATRSLRTRRRRERGLGPDSAARGLGKLLVVAPDQRSARRYRDLLRGWIPAVQGERAVRLATSAERDAPEALAAFRLHPEPSVLVTVAMAYEGLDAPEVAVVAALTHIRSRPWLEQMIARATRVDPHAGPYESQGALVYHPDDPLFASFRRGIETEQAALARCPRSREAPRTPEWLLPHLAAHRTEGEGRGITPLESNALGLRYATLRPGPAFAAARPERREAQGDPYDPPSIVERRLRARIGEMVAGQAVEDEASLRAPRAKGLYHRYNAVLKRVFGKARPPWGRRNSRRFSPGWSATGCATTWSFWTATTATPGPRPAGGGRRPGSREAPGAIAAPATRPAGEAVEPATGPARGSARRRVPLPFRSPGSARPSGRRRSAAPGRASGARLDPGPARPPTGSGTG
jgi:hypothetical protein